MCVSVRMRVCARDEAHAMYVWQAEVEVLVLLLVGGRPLFHDRLQGGHMLTVTILVTTVMVILVVMIVTTMVMVTGEPRATRWWSWWIARHVFCSTSGLQTENCPRSPLHAQDKSTNSKTLAVSATPYCRAQH